MTSVVSRVKGKLRASAYAFVSRTIALSATNGRVRRSLKFMLRSMILAFPKSLRDHYETRWIFDAGLLLHEQLLGVEIFTQHIYPRVVGGRVAISAIIPHYEKQEDLIECIRSIRLQKLDGLKPDEIEIIVVDDGSPNFDPASLPEDVQVVVLRRNMFGASRCRNAGAKLSNGRLLLFPDPDLIYPETYFEDLYRLHVSLGPRVVLSGYLEDYFYEGCPDPRTAFGVWETPDRLSNRFLQISAGSVALDRNLFFEAGGFDEDLIYGEVEDIHFGFKLEKLPQVQTFFASSLRIRHVPHMTTEAHTAPADSLRVVALKDPDFFQGYVIEGRR